MNNISSEREALYILAFELGLEEEIELPLNFFSEFLLNLTSKNSRNASSKESILFGKLFDKKPSKSIIPANIENQNGRIKKTILKQKKKKLRVTQKSLSEFTNSTPKIKRIKHLPSKVIKSIEKIKESKPDSWADEIMKELEIIFRSFIMGELKKKYNEEWWIKGIPERIRNKTYF